MTRVLLALVLVVSMAGCVRHSPNRIIIWNQMQPMERDILDKHLALFGQKYPDWEFKQLYYETEELRTNYLIAALGGSGPTMIHGPSDQIPPMLELDVLRPMEDLFDSSFLSLFIDTTVNTLTWLKNPRSGETHLYQIADQVGNHLCLIYNKKLIATPPDSLSELLELSKRMTIDQDGDGRPEQYGIVWNYIEPYFFFPFFTGYGGRIFDENRNPQLNSQAAIESIRLIDAMRNTYRIIPLESNYDLAKSMFKEGRSAMIIDGPWSWGDYIKSGMDIGIARIPYIESSGKWPAPIVATRGYSLNPNMTPEQTEKAVELLKYLNSPEVQLEMSLANFTIPSRKEAFFSPEIQNNPIMKASIDQISVGTPMPLITEIRAVWDGMRPGYQSIFGNPPNTPEKAAEMMQERTTTLIKDFRK
ncbi:MAG: extracellular solute-binding protein [Bacteroidetes bacterium]|nr:extracellular solute-binding protein [Bacteroidota bacterium]